LEIDNKLAFVLHSLAALLEHLAVPDKAGTRIGGQFKVLRQLKTISWAGFLTESTEHTTRRVEDELIENFFVSLFVGNVSLYVLMDVVVCFFYSKLVVLFRINIQPPRAVETWRDVRANRRILLRIDSFTGHRVPVGQRTYIELQRQAESFYQINHEEAFQLLRERWLGNGY
jgi:hypothetical protein